MVRLGVVARISVCRPRLTAECRRVSGTGSHDSKSLQVLLLSTYFLRSSRGLLVLSQSSSGLDSESEFHRISWRNHTALEVVRVLTYLASGFMVTYLLASPSRSPSLFANPTTVEESFLRKYLRPQGLRLSTYLLLYHVTTSSASYLHVTCFAFFAFLSETHTQSS